MPEMTADLYAGMRERMVIEQIQARGIRDPEVLAALRRVPRHLFVEPSLQNHSYEDRPLSIGLGQTISQPFMVAYMVENLMPAGRRILEIGTGSGYATAVLSCLADEVFSMEVEAELSGRAGEVLRGLGCANVRLRIGDGLQGWSEQAPFSRIVLTAAVDSVPQVLLEQLEIGGCFLGPVGHPMQQKLVRIQRTSDGFRSTDLMSVLFVQVHQK